MADKVIISKSKLTALGDVIREKTGGSEKMTVDVMTETMRNHSGGSGMPDNPYNNPDLPKLYYGMNALNKKLKINVYEAVKNSLTAKVPGAIDYLNVTFNDYGGTGVSFPIAFFRTYSQDDNFITYKENVYSSSLANHTVGEYISVSVNRRENYIKVGNLTFTYTETEDFEKTVGELLQEIGTIELDMSTDGYLANSSWTFDALVLDVICVYYDPDYGDATGTFPGSNNTEYTRANLNENPIDYMWIE